MEKIISFDKQGRLYIPEELRKLLRFKTIVARSDENGIFLQPLEEDPIEALARLGKDKLKGKSIKHLKKEARKEIEKHAKKIR